METPQMSEQPNQFQNPNVGSGPMQQPQQPGRFKFNKVSVIVLILAILIAGGSYAGIWYWMKQSTDIAIPTYTPRPDATAGWKTYTNTQYGFEFKYPKDFVIIEGESIKINPSNWKDSNNGLFSLRLVSNPQRLDINTYYKNIEQKEKESDMGLINGDLTKNATVQKLLSGETVYITRNAYCVIECDLATWAHSNNIYVFNNGHMDYLKQNEIYNQILTTFKFIP